MSDYRKEYQSKLCTVEEAVSILKTGDNVIVGTGATAPVTILNKLHLAADHADEINMLFMAGDNNYPFLTDPKYAGVFHNNSVFSGKGDRIAYARNTASYVPAHLYVYSNQQVSNVTGSNAYYAARMSRTFEQTIPTGGN